MLAPDELQCRCDCRVIGPQVPVASLMDEVDTNSRNKQDLLNMVGMLEEDLTIKT